MENELMANEDPIDIQDYIDEIMEPMDVNEIATIYQEVSAASEILEKMDDTPLNSTSLEEGESEGESEEEQVLPPNQFVVEKIMDTKVRYGKVQYLIKWLGFPDSENSWELERNVHCKDLVQQFEEERSKQLASRKKQIRPTVSYSRKSKSGTRTVATNKGREERKWKIRKTTNAQRLKKKHILKQDDTSNVDRTGSVVLVNTSDHDFTKLQETVVESVTVASQEILSGSGTKKKILSRKSNKPQQLDDAQVKARRATLRNRQPGTEQRSSTGSNHSSSLDSGVVDSQNKKYVPSIDEEFTDSSSLEIPQKCLNPAANQLVVPKARKSGVPLPLKAYQQVCDQVLDVFILRDNICASVKRLSYFQSDMPHVVGGKGYSADAVLFTDEPVNIIGYLEDAEDCVYVVFQSKTPAICWGLQKTVMDQHFPQTMAAVTRYGLQEAYRRIHDVLSKTSPDGSNFAAV